MPAVDGQLVVSILGVAVLCGIVGLDRTAVGQFMFSQPIVAGPLTGWVLGDATAGAVIGAVLELIWVLDMPVGSFVPADSTVCAVSAVAIAALGSPAGADLSVIGFSVLLTAFMVPATMRADNAVRYANSRFLDGAMDASGPEKERELARAQGRGLVYFFLKSFVLCLLFVPLGLALTGLFRGLPGFAHDAMRMFIKLLPLLGAAAIVRKLSILAVDRFVLIGFFIAALGGLALHAPSPFVLLCTAAAGWVGAHYREKRA